ncbi:amino acid adenylation [Trichoderma citrinoviride]|uniref:Amino acid adenylation n=1 Tax=Trichoderma citrinoviride TaxID=58853 RepID=A0A2T4AZ50_9HYPO|nr:amino acid adenylation [Trichoderma citrinoviride]PTB62343.1 amino acid adenylation [Trichoderma citrinoviride]
MAPSELAHLNNSPTPNLQTTGESLPLPPPPVNRLVQDVIEDQVLARPDAQAIASRTVNLTYKELDESSSRLATQISSSGVSPGCIVPILHEKSAVTIVAMLAVLKAGCAFTALDVSHPTQRLLEVIEDTNAPLLLLSPKQAARFNSYTKVPIIELSQYVFSGSATTIPSHAAPSAISPRHLMYTIFTSGSTGRPKGVMIEHAAWLTSALAYGADQELGPSSRVLQFASYAFDMSVMEIFTTLIFGGCICVPAEEDRYGRIQEFVNEMGVDTLMLTPSYAKLLDPATMPAVKMLITGGEAVPSDLIQLWNPHVKVYIAYGPTEASIQAAGVKLEMRTEAVPSGLIGRPTGCNLWIVREDNHNELVPRGEVGELVIEGNTLARGYLGDQAKTAASFVDMSIGTDTRRVFKTGDLARQTNGGDIVFVGRKDTQIKMQGQRFELAEIEARLSQTLPVGFKLCVDKAESPHFHNGGAIVAFLGDSVRVPDDEHPEILWDQVEAMLDRSREITLKLEKVLPKPVIPSLYVPVSFIPLTTSHKTNRNALRELVAALSSEELQRLRRLDRSRGESRALTDDELILRELWAFALNMAPESIRPDDHFIQLGGDSVTSIKLIAAARSRGISLTSTAVLSNPVLSEQARLAFTSAAAKRDEDIQPFGLLGDRAHELRATAAAICKLPVEEIEDVLPMTISQMRWYGKTLVKPDAYVDQYHFQLPGDVDLVRFRSALNSVVQAADLLRARVLATRDKKLFQAIVRFHPVEVVSSSDALEAYLSRDIETPMGLGAPLSRYAILHHDHSARVFVWTIHHAIYDGYSLPMLLQAIQDVYHGLEPAPFTPFNRYLKGPDENGLEEGEAFWKNYLQQASWTKFPALPPPQETASPHMGRLLKTLNVASRQARLGDAQGSQAATMANVIRVAYAATLSHFATDQPSSVLFLESLGGRNSSVEGIERVAGPTLVTVPTRLELPREKPCSQVVLEGQRSLIERMRFESFPLPRLLPLAPPLELRSVLMIENEAFLINGDGRGLFGRGKEELKLEETEGLPMIFRCTVFQGRLDVDVRYDSTIVADEEMDAFLARFEKFLKELWEGDGTRPFDVVASS